MSERMTQLNDGEVDGPSPGGEVSPATLLNEILEKLLASLVPDGIVGAFYVCEYRPAVGSSLGQMTRLSRTARSTSVRSHSATTT